MPNDWLNANKSSGLGRFIRKQLLAVHSARPAENSPQRTKNDVLSAHHHHSSHAGAVLIGRKRIVALLARVVIQRPLLVLAIAAVFAAVGTWLGATKLSLNADTNALIGDERPFMQKYRELLAEFGDLEGIVVVVDPMDASGASRKKAELAIEALGQALQPLLEQHLIERIHWKITPLEQWTIAARATETPMLAALVQSPALCTQGVTLETKYLSNPGGRLLFLEIMPKKDFSRFEAIEDALGAIRVVVATVAKQHPSVEIGLTGKPVLQADELATSNQDMMRASLGALVIITALFILVFRGVRLPFFAVLAFLCASAWTIGAAALLVGQLTLLSSVFMLVLVGAGLDYGVHVVSRYQELRRSLLRDDAITQTLQSIAPGTITGALTSATVFYLAILTDFAGLRELGFIAGTGLLLCAIAMLTVLPALLVIGDANPALHPPRDSDLPSALAKPNMVRVLGWSAFAIACIALAPFGLRFDSNLLALQAEHLASVEWEHRVFADSSSASWFAASTAKSEAEALAFIERAKGEPLILCTRSAFDIIKPETAERAALRSALGTAIHANPTTDSLAALVRGASLPLRDALPLAVRDNMVSPRGALLVAYVPREDAWNAEPLERFVDAVRRVDPDATGVPMTQLESIRDMKSAFITVSLLSVFAITLLAWLDFRRLTPTLLATASVLVGVLMLLGLLPLCGSSLNLANFFAIPMLLGLGIDSAIHVLHRWQSDHTRMRPTMRAVAFTAITTAIGFGALIFAQHRGLQSLGLAMLLGSLTCLFASNVLLPMFLALFHTRSTTQMSSVK